MRQDLHTSFGFFSPSFFRMHVDIDEDLADLNNISTIASATFFHEYVHYVQDISTTYGLMNIINVVNYIKSANEVMNKGGVNSLKIPFKPPTRHQTIQDNRDVDKIYLGSGKGFSNCSDFKVYTKIETLGFDKKSHSVKRVFIAFKNASGEPEKYNFGGYCISESMAYGIEYFVYPGVLPAPPQLPYTSADIIVQQVYPEFGKDPMNTIALCDASLMLFNPGAYFYDMLVQMRDSNWLPKSSNDIYPYVERNVAFNFQGKTTIKDLFEYIQPLAIQALCDYFTSADVFKENHIWIKDTIVNAGKFRLQMPDFMLDVTLIGEIKSNPCFAALIEVLGTPLYTNQQQLAWFHSRLYNQGVQLAPESMFAVHSVYLLLSRPWTDRPNLCSMFNFCQKSCEVKGIADYTDYRCRVNPWNRSNDPDPDLCHFGALWKSWGLQGKELTDE